MTKKYDEEMIEVAIKHLGHEVLIEAAAEDGEGLATVSDQFDTKMRALIRRKTAQQAGARMMKVLYRVAAVLLIMVAIFAVAVVSSEALRARVINLLYEIGDGKAQISFSGADAEQLPEGMVLPGYLPDGYELAGWDQTAERIESRYENGTGDLILIWQNPLNSQIVVTQDGATPTEIAGRTAYVIDNGDTKVVIFNNDWYSFVVSGNIDISELQIIAESMLE